MPATIRPNGNLIMAANKPAPRTGQAERDDRLPLVTAPRLVPEVATWAAERFYRACQFLVYREADADQVRAGCAVPCPAAAAPEVCYSADLIFRCLPDVFALARGKEGKPALVVVWGAVGRGGR